MRLKKLGSIAEIIAGQSPLSKTYNEDGIGLPFFQGKADFQDKYPKAKTWCTSSKRKEAVQGDILISVRAPVGSVNICDQLSIIGRGLSAIRPLEGINGEYLYYFFKSNERKIANLGTGSTFKAITQEILKKIQIPIPIKDGKPFIDDQIRIATLLNKVESLIAKRKKSIEDLDELLKSTFLEMFGDPVKNEMGWDRKPLNEFIVSCRNGLSPSKSGTVKGKVFILSAITGKSFREIYKEAFFNNVLEKYFPKTNDFLVCRGNGNINLVGRGFFFNGESNDILFPDTIISLTIDTEKIEKSYLEQIWQNHLLRSQIESNARTTNGTYKINQAVINKIMLVCPPLNLQNSFASIVTKVESIKERYRKSLTGLENLYGTLSQKVFKGELDLSRIPLEKEADAQQETVEPQPQIQETVKEPQ
jgi:type I restriction enzyme S subunit